MRVYHAGIIRSFGILGVELDDTETYGGILAVDGSPDRFVEVLHSRVVWDEGNKLTRRRILVVKPPDFPIEELKGNRLVMAIGSDI